MGSVPSAGQWVRLQVPAATLGLENVPVDGMVFALYAGTATWDAVGLKKDYAEDWTSYSTNGYWKRVPS